MTIDPNNFLHSLARFMAAAAGGLVYSDLAGSITHSFATAENSGTLASILPADMRAMGFVDDGMVQEGSANNASPPSSNNYAPPVRAAWETLADIAASRGICLTVEAENDLRYAYDTWESNNALCLTRMGYLATGLGYMKARQPSVPLWIEHQDVLAQDLAVARPHYDTFVATAAGMFSPLIAGCTVVVYFTSLDFAAWDAAADFYRDTFSRHYPGKRVKLIANSYLQGTNLYVGDEAMQHVVDYAAAHDCDVEWWQASTTAPMQPEAYAFLRRLGVTLEAGGGSASSSPPPRALWRNLADETNAADPYSVLRFYGGPAQRFDPLERLSIQCMTTGTSGDGALSQAAALYRTLLADDGTPLRMTLIPATRTDGSADAPGHYRLVYVDPGGKPGLIGIDDRKRQQASFSFDVGVFQAP